MLESSASRLQWTFRILLLAVLGSLLLSSAVWLTDRNFPVLPIFSFLPSAPSPVDYLLYCVLVVLLIYQMIYLQNRNTLYALIGLFAFLLLGDQMRWQPYNIQFFLMLCGLFFYPKNTEELLNVFRLLIVAFFIWSGIQQLNETFSGVVYPWLAKPLSSRLPDSVTPILFNSYGFSLLNILAGVGLLFEKTRNIAVYFGIAVATFLLHSLSPMGNDWNRAFLPYYAAIGFFTYLLFYKATFDVKQMIWSKTFRFQQVILVVCILPALSFAGIYDRTQSFNLTYGRTWSPKIYVTEELVDKLPDGVKRYVNRPPLSDPFIDINEWTLHALKVAPYSEPRINKDLHDYICSFAEGDCPAKLK